MSNTGQIKRYKFSDSEVSFGIPQPIDSDNGEFVKYDDHFEIVIRLRQRMAGQLKLLQVAGKRIEHLESLLPDEV